MHVARILIVDDSVFARRHLDEILTSMGHETIQGEDGIDALWLYKQERPDAVMLDIDMPILDGEEALHKLLQLDRKARIAMVTASRNQELVMGLIKQGAKDFIGKPYETARVMEAVEKLLAA